jgi:hypothetical protein
MFYKGGLHTVMQYSQEHVSNWIEAYKDKAIIINKKEDGDLDQVELQLEKVSLGKLNEEDPDEYVSMETLLLHGEGIIHSGGHSGSLPLDAYEIPLTDGWLVKEMEDRLEIKTERAVYTIQPRQK